MQSLKTLSLITTFLFASQFVATQAVAEGLRCNSDIVNTGDAKASVLQKCGEPMLKDSFCNPTTVVNDGNECEKIETWTYNPGSGKFLTTLKFSQGKIIAIEYGARVP
ncbi:DUF2845 domain-containing protein [Rheinheimera riviphila]|uniref:DUF2845 domain-containing protein n=1 Tax=Rheinheimera riviphila TaxID=1834037 RepID=A0A437QIQ6_9GAMM|nr:DUF2845 domain-containing protein [Rheinheimera riviphila]RVU34411.1 DUF2845 domain-containing protein [Rheinheimera riviphila]